MHNLKPARQPAKFSLRRALLGAGLFAAVLFSGLVSADRAAAAVAGGFSLGVGEEYNDNIFFNRETRNSLHPLAPRCPRCDVNDWITHIVPTFTLLYAPPGDPTPALTATLSPEGQIYTRNPELNNFGDNVTFNSIYTYRATPTFDVNFTNNFNRQGVTRTIGLEALGPPPQVPQIPTEIGALGSFVPLPLAQGIEQLVSRGRTITNSFTVQPVWRYSPTVTFSGGYSAGYNKANGVNEFTHSAGLRGVYNWRENHNLFAGYTVNIFDTSGKTAVIHNIDLGDDFFTGLKIRLAPTWTLSGALGFAFNSGNTGPKFVNNVNLTLIKVWEDAIFNVAIRRGITTSVGIFAGPSTTNVFSSGYGIRLTERLTALAGADYSILDTQPVNVHVFRASAGLQYWINNWLSSNVWYSRRWRHAGPGSNDVRSGSVGGDSVMMGISAHFDLYPNLGLAQAAQRPLYAPMGTPVYERTELQQPLRPPAGTPEMQQQLQQPLRPESVRPPPPPPPAPSDQQEAPAPR